MSPLQTQPQTHPAGQIDSQDSVFTSTPVSAPPAQHAESTPGTVMRECHHTHQSLQPEQQLEILSLLFSEFSSQYPSSLRVSSDF